MTSASDARQHAGDEEALPERFTDEVMVNWVRGFHDDWNENKWKQQAFHPGWMGKQLQNRLGGGNGQLGYALEAPVRQWLMDHIGYDFGGFTIRLMEYGPYRGQFVITSLMRR